MVALAGLDHLEKLLAVVKSDGLDSVFSEGVPNGGQRSDVQNVSFQTYQEPLRSLQCSLVESKLCMAALDAIKARLAKKIRKMQRRCAPLVLEDGIQRIPDEILAHVFEAGHQMSAHSQFALRLSHVCGRFRRVSLRTPLLWTRLSSEHPSDQTEAYLTRSGQMDLQVTLSDHPGDEFRSSLQLMGTHSDRWSRLLLLMDPDDQEIFEEVGLAHFPRLRSIFYHGNVEPTGLQWAMPSLSQFEGFCSPFPLAVSFSFLLQLTSMEICFKDYASFDMTSLAHVLYNMSNLRNLSLEFQSCDAVDFDANLAPDTPKPQSFHIDSLKVTFGGSVALDLVKSLYAVLEYLVPSRVDISLLTHGDLHNFLTSAGILSYSSTIGLQFGFRCNLLLTIYLLLQNCKALRSLRIERSDFNAVAYMRPQWPHFPNLRHIQFYDCIMHEKNVEPMVRALLRCEDLESLEFISCHKISEDCLLNLHDIVGDRLTWGL
ncbi:hypothetical protein BD410DRAFT_155278 [Rickenella mellea]|uniref:F-box domain-containing protein n=1 Tax=Rickenella mellea TaxID=50990 RepID=A0A4Y7PHQ0_9AGAM|nr:hypothetical protein BD410DRAFT_155278 [Rickenella mellea]